MVSFITGGVGIYSILYTVTKTVKANNLNPFRYLDYVLTVLKDHQDDVTYSFIKELFPWSDQLLESCRNRSKATNLQIWPPETVAPK